MPAWTASLLHNLHLRKIVSQCTARDSSLFFFLLSGGGGGRYLEGARAEYCAGGATFLRSLSVILTAKVTRNWPEDDESSLREAESQAPATQKKTAGILLKKQLDILTNELIHLASNIN